MYPLENQVCILKQAKIFKDEFELALESYFEWVEIISDGIGTFQVVRKGEMLNGVQYRYMKRTPAYSCAELDYLYLNYRHIGYDSVTVSIPFYEGGSYSSKGIYTMDFKEKETELGYFEHGAHWRAQVIIEMLRQKLIKAEDLKL